MRWQLVGVELAGSWGMLSVNGCVVLGDIVIQSLVSRGNFHGLLKIYRFVGM